MASCSKPNLGKRKPNFTESENLHLVEQFENHKAILNSKITSVETNREKQHVWQEICIGLNTLNSNQGRAERTVKEIRRKWKNMVTSAKRHARQLNGISTDPHGRTLKPLSALSQKIIEMKRDCSKVETDENDSVIVEIKTEQQENGYCTESISKKGPLKVFYSTVEPEDVPAAAVAHQAAYNTQTINASESTYDPSSDDSTAVTPIRVNEAITARDGIDCYETNDDEFVAGTSMPGGAHKRRSKTNTAPPSKISKSECEMSALKKEKLLLEIDKLQSEKEKLALEKERLGLEIQFWKRKLESTE